MGMRLDAGSGNLRLRRTATSELTTTEIAAIRELMVVAFGSDEDERFTDEDWAHSIGGVHFVLEEGGALVAHASVVERHIHIDGRPLWTGYVEAVATAPVRQREGHGSVVMEAVGAHIRDTFDLGALGTGRHHFYERLGWETWAGPAFVRTPKGPQRTPDEEGYILILRTPRSPAFGLDAALSVEWRPGDVW